MIVSASGRKNLIHEVGVDLNAVRHHVGRTEARESDDIAMPSAKATRFF